MRDRFFLPLKKNIVLFLMGSLLYMYLYGTGGLFDTLSLNSFSGIWGRERGLATFIPYWGRFRPAVI